MTLPTAHVRRNFIRITKRVNLVLRNVKNVTDLRMIIVQSVTILSLEF